MYHTIRMLKLVAYIQVLVLLWTVSSLCRSQMYNIWPSINCFSQPCLTLEHFTVNMFKNASVKQIKLILTPGNHSLSSELLFANLEYLSLNTTSDTSQETRIICHSSGHLSLFNISQTLINGIGFLECSNNTAVDLKHLIINNCTLFLGSNGSLSLLKFQRTNAILNTSLFYIIDMRNRIDSESVEPAFSCLESNVTIEASKLTTKGTAFLLAESESIIQIKNTSIRNSTTRMAAWLDHPSALIQISSGKLFIEKSEITQNKGEMIIYARQCEVKLSKITLSNNWGVHCILCTVKSQVLLNDTLISGNHGNFSIIYLLKTGTNITGGMIFSRNVGSLLVLNSNVQFFSSTTFTKCTQSWLAPKNNHLQAQGTLTVIQSTIVFWENVTFIDNKSTRFGGAIYSSETKITIYNFLLVANNTVLKGGGGAFLYLSTFICHGQCNFERNRANMTGGGIHAISSVVSLSNGSRKTLQISNTSLKFIGNEAGHGGAIYFELNSYLKCLVDRINQYSIIFDGNFANNDGGAIFIRDETYFGTCNSTSSFHHHTRTECFFQITYNDIDVKTKKEKHSITFINNTAGRGSVLYGGLLDRCSLSPMADIYNTAAHKSFTGFEYFINESRGIVELNDIESDAMRLCRCQDAPVFNCQNHQSVHVQKSEGFNISVMAIDQVNRTIFNATIRSDLREESILGEGQQLQHTEGNCTNLMFNVSSPFESVKLTLYADQGPCKDKGLSSFTVNITFKCCKCNIGFVRSNDLRKCECNLDPKLKDYVRVLNTSSIVRTRNCWLNYTYDESNYEYVIHPKCPYDYCILPSPTDVTVGIITMNETNGADAQCNYNRSGMLCGKCKQGYSLSMCGSHCIPCPKYWPGLVTANLLTGALLGIILVFLLLLLNLTVAWGTPNGIIFYANVMLINKNIFLPSNTEKLNFITIVIYFLNTQVGMRRCFWEGMTAYGRTWFSYAFPLYMISLVLAIIIISKYSLRCARLLGRRNPVATLASLILLTYAYFLRSILDVLSFTVVKYPDGTREIVWLPDASVRYLQGKHIPLFLSAIALTTVGLAYTILLFSWQWLQKLPNVIILRWLRSTKLNSFIEAYHAPYKPKYRYWTGLLLFVRIALSVAIAANISGDPQYNLLATGILVSSLIVFKVYLGDNVYKNKVIDYLENACYLNLLLLTLVTFYSLSNENVHKIATYASIGVISILSLCVLTYHTYSALRSTRWCQKACTVVILKMKRHKTATNHVRNLELNTKTFNKCISTEVSISALAMDQDKITEKESENTHEAVVRTIEQEAYTPESLIEPLL